MSSQLAESPVSPGIQQRITATLFVAQGINGAAALAMITVTSIVAAQLGGSDAWAGFPNMLIYGGRALIGYPVAWVMDHWGRRAAFVIGYFLAALGALISGLAILQHSFWIFSLGSCFLGMGRGISEQTRYAAAEVYPPHQRARIIGLMVFAGTIGSIGGPLLAIPASTWASGLGIDQNIGPHFWAVAMSLLALLLTFVFLRPDPLVIGQQMAQGSQEQRSNAPTRMLSEIFADPAVRLALAAMAIGQLVMTLLMVITPLYMLHHNHEQAAISGVLMAHTLGMFGLAMVTGWLVDRLGQRTIIVAGGLVLISAAVLTPVWPQTIPLALALFLLGLGWNFCFTAGSSLLANSLRPTERARVQGTGETLVAISSGLGSLGTGIAFQFGGIILVCAIGLALTLVFMALAVWSNQRTPLVPVGGD